MKHEAVNPERGSHVRVTYQPRTRDPAVVWDEAAALRAELALRMASYPCWLKRRRIDRATMDAQIAHFKRAIAAAQQAQGGHG